MKRIYHILFFSCFMLRCIAQQVGMYNHYFFNPFVYNPAFAGNTSNNIQTMLLSHSQWTGFSNAPQLNIFTLEGPVRTTKAGLGLMLISDKRGLNQRTGGDLAYSYRITLNEEARVLLGLSLGLINQTFDFSKAVSQNSSDPTLFTSAQQKITFDGSGGVAFLWKGLTVGASALQVLGNRVNYADNTGIRTYYSQVRHYLSSAKYRFYLSEDKGISVSPMALIRIVPNTPLQYEGNLTFDWYNKLWAGATYKSNYAVAVNAGICLHKKLAVGYSYEFITSSIGKYAGVSHEIMVHFKFGPGKKEPSADSAKAEQQRQVAKDNTYQQKIDSLQVQLAESSENIQQLTQKLKEQSALQKQTKDQVQSLEKNVQDLGTKLAESQRIYPGINAGSTNLPSAILQNNAGTTNSSVNPPIENNNPSYNTNQNASVLNKLSSQSMEDGVPIATDPIAGYKNESNLPAKAAYYVVVGTFYYRDFAEAEMKRFRARGYTQSGLVFSEAKLYNYVFAGIFFSKQEAVQKTKTIQAAGNKDAWILQLTK